MDENINKMDDTEMKMEEDQECRRNCQNKEARKDLISLWFLNFYFQIFSFDLEKQKIYFC